MNALRALRPMCGVFALAAALFAANVLVIQQAPFAPPVLYGAAAALLAGHAWLVL